MMLPSIRFGAVFHIVNQDAAKGARKLSELLYQRGQTPGIREIGGDTFVLSNEDLVRYRLGEYNEQDVQNLAVSIRVGISE